VGPGSQGRRRARCGRRPGGRHDGAHRAAAARGRTARRAGAARDVHPRPPSRCGPGRGGAPSRDENRTRR